MNGLEGLTRGHWNSENIATKQEGGIYKCVFIFLNRLISI